MKTEILTVTPAMAKKWLEKNIINRKLRPAVVSGYAEALKRGEWKLTHQGLAFNKKGEMLDGQHRCTAIVETGKSVRCQVSWDCESDVFDAFDLGLKRTTGDVLKISTARAAVARFLAVIEDTTRKNGITPQFLIPFVDAIEDVHGSLVTFCPMLARTWSSAAVQSAAVIRLMDGEDSDYVHIVYHALVHQEYDSMPPIAQALVRQHKAQSVRANMDFFARSLKVFTKANASSKKIQISGTASTLEYAREVIAREIRGVGKLKVVPTPAAGKAKASGRRSVNLV